MTLSYVVVYYAFISNVLRVKVALAREYQARGEKFDRYLGGDRTMLAADRIQLNTLEHMGPFLALLWLHAAFASPWGATVAGALYIASRLAYSFMLGAQLGRSIRKRVMLATITGYAVLAYLGLGTFFALLR